MSSSHLILCHPLLLLPPIPPSIRVFSNDLTLCMRSPKYWSISFSISPSNKNAGLISFRMDWLDLLAVQGTLKSLLQHHSSKASIIYHRARTNNFTICMEIQKTSTSQSNLEEEEWNWKNQPAWLQALLQSHSHQDSMVLAQRQKYRSMEQNRKPSDKSTHIWTPYLWQRRQEYTMEKRQSL